jgi:hypothetical protein
MRRNLGALLLGALAGGMLIHLNHARCLEQLHWDKEKLKVQLFECTERLSRMEATWEEQQKGEISSVKFVIQGEIEPFASMEMQPDLVVALLQRRKLTVEKKDYMVTVNWVVIAPETLFNINVSPAPEEGPGG